MSDKTVLGCLETIKHISTVRKNIYKCIVELDSRLRDHDQSKLVSPEAEIFGEWTPELAKVEYGTPEYDALLDKVRPAIEHHYANNRHHPEHHKNGISDMTLIDLVEMLCDWKAATERNKNGNIRKSLEVNAKRYGIDDQLLSILENTVKEMF